MLMCAPKTRSGTIGSPAKSPGRSPQRSPAKSVRSGRSRISEGDEDEYYSDYSEDDKPGTSTNHLSPGRSPAKSSSNSRKSTASRNSDYGSDRGGKSDRWEKYNSVYIAGVIVCSGEESRASSRISKYSKYSKQRGKAGRSESEESGGAGDSKRSSARSPSYRASTGESNARSAPRSAGIDHLII